MAKVYSVDYLRKVVNEMSLSKKLNEESNEFKPVYGKDVERENKKNNSAAYKQMENDTKAYDGGLAKQGSKKGETVTPAMNGGMSDLRYDSISKPFKDKVKAQLKGYTSAEAEKAHKGEALGNATINSDESVKELQKHAEDRKKAHDQSRSDGLVGSQYKDEKKKSDETMFESKKISRLSFKNLTFLSEGHMLTKVPDEFKVEGKRFGMKDSSGNEYLVEWHENKPDVTKKVNMVQVNEEMDRIKQLYSYKRKDYYVTTTPQSRVDENAKFSGMLDRARKLMK